MSRRQSRELGLQFLFQMEFHEDDINSMKQLFFEETQIKDSEREYFDALVDGVYENKRQLDEIYSAYLKNWNLSRVAKIDQTILRIATYEIIHLPAVPFNVSVSEAVILAKKYSTEESRSFINGVLKNLEDRKIKE